MTEVFLSSLLTFTRDGEWGKGEPAEGLKPAFVIRGTDFERVRYGNLTDLPVRYIDAKKLERKQLRPDDILIEAAGGTKDQPTGRNVHLKERLFDEAEHPLICASFARFLRPDSNAVVPEFLFWKLQDEYNSRRMMPYHVQHTGVARFQYTQFANSHGLSLPSLDDQERSADLLSSLDDKIELNRRINETLEAQARALFRDWFVDFGPVKAKIAGVAPYLAPDLWSLFPDALDGEGVPQGWRITPLDQVADFLNGLALQKFPPLAGEPSLPVVKIADLRTGPTEKSNRASMALPEKYVIDDGDFIFSWSGSLLAKFWTHGKGALNQHLFKVTSDQFPNWFFCQWVWHHMAEFKMIAASKATTMGHIQRGHLSAAMCLVPPAQLLATMTEVMAPLLERTIANELENRTLAQIRDLLLPKLMSGEVRVGAIARELELTP